MVAPNTQNNNSVAVLNVNETDVLHISQNIIPTRADQNRYAQSRIPMDMIRQG